MKTTAIFKAIVTLKSGAHRIVRVTIDKVATLVAALSSYKRYGILCDRHRNLLRQLELNVGDIKCAKFLNERTGEELLSV